MLLLDSLAKLKNYLMKQLKLLKELVFLKFMYFHILEEKEPKQI